MVFLTKTNGSFTCLRFEVAAVAVDPPHFIKREVLLVDHVGVPVVGGPGCVLGPITCEVLCSATRTGSYSARRHRPCACSCCLRCRCPPA